MNVAKRSMPDMHTAIPCTGSTADQAVSTVHVQLGAAKHLTRPLTREIEKRETNEGHTSFVFPLIPIGYYWL